MTRSAAGDGGAFFCRHLAFSPERYLKDDRSPRHTRAHQQYKTWEGNDEGEALRNRFCGTLDGRLLTGGACRQRQQQCQLEASDRHHPGGQCGGDGGGQPWSTLGGEARVNLGSGHVEFEVRGLVLAGGNTIGTVPSTINQVKGTIVCNPGPTQVVVDTPFVPLSAQGDAEFDGNIGHLPAGCAPNNLAFLVRIASTPTDRWIANGAVRSSP